MAGEMFPYSLEQLTNWVFEELYSRNSVFGIPRELFFTPRGNESYARTLYGRRLETPIGVAAGPQTQLAQNIIAAYLCGARFIELKTVQVLDSINVNKPCIDVEDVGYNCEWSQELHIPQSMEEYLKAYLIIEALRDELDLPTYDNGPGFIFNMSVGYNLDGIKSDKVKSFFANMKDSTAKRQELLARLSDKYRKLLDRDIPAMLSDNITLSTMHGCPPAEIERIALYLIEELGLNTTIKLNPTLLGPTLLRQILNKDLGYGDDIFVPDSAFGHDPTMEAAVPMIGRLRDAAAKKGVFFGLKLTNTLETVNQRKQLPDDMHYMSGRALHPLSVNLGYELRKQLGFELPISFAGGADAFNIADLIESGFSPVTCSSDLLRPGGYGRLAQYLEALEAAGTITPSMDKLADYAAEVRHDERYMRPRVAPNTKTNRELKHFDCIKAPCQDTCPAHQNVPDYLWLTAAGRYDDAMAVILAENALPSVIGSICDHPCTAKCTRNKMDRPLAIREIKRFVSEQAFRNLEQVEDNGYSVAVVGAGPGGMAAAFYLALAGFKVTVYDEGYRPGGIPAKTIPSYRLPDSAVARDVEMLEKLGVSFVYGLVIGKDRTIEDLKEKYNFVYLSVGARNSKKLGLEHEDAAGVYGCLDFLKLAKAGKIGNLGKNVAVIGGGNSAMDAVRTAWRLADEDANVSLIYRRTKAQMPADPDEIRDVEEEGVKICELRLQKAIKVDSEGHLCGLVVSRMELGEKDASGRATPVEVPNSEETIPLDTLIVAVSQELDGSVADDSIVTIGRKGIEVDENGRTAMMDVYAGGDAVRGAATAIRAVADARRVAAVMAHEVGASFPCTVELDKDLDFADAIARRSYRDYGEDVPTLELAKRHSFERVIKSFDEEGAQLEASRCLDCDEICSLCDTVCPNRANITYMAEAEALRFRVLTVVDGKLVMGDEDGVEVNQRFQTLNLADCCNECGNCKAFCPSAGAPFADKPRLCFSDEAFAAEEHGYRVFKKANGGFVAETKGKKGVHRLECCGNILKYDCPVMTATFKKVGDQLIIKDYTLKTDNSCCNKMMYKVAELYLLAKNLLNSVSYLPFATID